MSEDALVVLGTRLGLARQGQGLEVALLGHRHPRLGLVGMAALELRPLVVVSCPERPTESSVGRAGVTSPLVLPHRERRWRI